MKVFCKRYNKPDKNNVFYYSEKNIFTRCNYGIPNCTCYAHGRFAEITGVWLPFYGNANTWFPTADKIESNTFYTGTVPLLGAVACWESTKKGGLKGAGHVAIVEDIRLDENKNYIIVCSNSAYMGTEFYMTEHSASNNYEWVSNNTKTKYTFQGFILPKEKFINYLQPMVTQGKLYLRTYPEKGAPTVMVMKNRSLFYPDGTEETRDNISWCHGYTVLANGVKKVGWCSKKYLRFANV